MTITVWMLSVQGSLSRALRGRSSSRELPPSSSSAAAAAAEAAADVTSLSTSPVSWFFCLSVLFRLWVCLCVCVYHSVCLISNVWPPPWASPCNPSPWCWVRNLGLVVALYVIFFNNYPLIHCRAQNHFINGPQNEIGDVSTLVDGFGFKISLSFESVMLGLSLQSISFGLITCLWANSLHVTVEFVYFPGVICYYSYFNLFVR